MGGSGVTLKTEQWKNYFVSRRVVFTEEGIRVDVDETLRPYNDITEEMLDVGIEALYTHFDSSGDFDCPSDIVTDIFRAMRDRQIQDQSQ